MFIRAIMLISLFIISCSDVEDKKQNEKIASTYEFKNNQNSLSISLYAKDNDIFSELNNFDKKPILLLFGRKECNLCIPELINLLNIKRNIGISVIMLASKIPEKLELNPMINITEASETIYISSSFSKFLDNFTSVTKFNFYDDNDPIIFLLDSNHKVIKVYEGVVIEESIQKDIKNLFCTEPNTELSINCDKV